MRCGGPFIPPPLAQILPLGCQRPGLVLTGARLIWTESFQIQTDPSEVARTSPAKAEAGFWLTQTSSNTAQTSPAKAARLIWITQTSSNTAQTSPAKAARLIWITQTSPDMDPN
jgi:hypothetical protein